MLLFTQPLKYKFEPQPTSVSVAVSKFWDILVCPFFCMCVCVYRVGRYQKSDGVPFSAYCVYLTYDAFLRSISRIHRLPARKYLTKSVFSFSCQSFPPLPAHSPLSLAVTRSRGPRRRSRRCRRCRFRGHANSLAVMALYE